jgi:hypothetical protein
LEKHKKYGDSTLIKPAFDIENEIFMDPEIIFSRKKKKKLKIAEMSQNQPTNQQTDPTIS